MRSAIRIGLLLLALIGATLPACATPIVVTDGPRLEVADKVEWCEGAPQLDVTAVLKGACRLAPASPKDLKRNMTEQAVWLRLVLVNPAPLQALRWLQIGHPRLTHVSFFESRGTGWRRSETGMAVPLAERPVRAADPILPVTLAPFERRTILVRIDSISAVDATPVLWIPDAYSLASENEALHSAIGLGALIASSIFILAIYFLWNARAYLYLCLFVLSVVGFSIAHSGMLQLHFWPVTWPFDLRLQALPGVGIAISFALFAGDFADSKSRYPRHYALLTFLIYAMALGTAWIYLVDYRSLALTLVILALITVAASALLLLRGQPKTLGIMRIPVIIIGLFLLARTVMMGIGVRHGISGGNFLIRDTWVFLMTCMPAALLGLTLHKQRMAMQLQASQAESAARVNFLARMSHELRTPLDVIIGTAQLLARPAHRARLNEGLADISANGRQLLKMIDEVLDYSRGLVGKLSLSPEAVRWPEFLRGVKHNAEILAAKNFNTAVLSVNGESVEAVRIDERRLRQVLDNLIANASRHTKNGKITLGCMVGPPREDGQRTFDFTVSDTGEGIRPEDIRRIFLPFERGGNSMQHGGKGVGMGLAISRQLVELMGGKLTVESTPGKGASFHFQVIAGPANAVDAKAPVMEHISGYAGARRTILVADDESENRSILAAMLRDSGFTVLEAASGRAAVAQFEEAAVDAVLTDQFMADGDGWYVLEKITERQSAVPVVLVSAAPPDRPPAFPAQIDFAKHLLKPLNHSEVLRCLGDLLGLDWIETAAATPVREEPLRRPGEAFLQDLREMIEAGRVSDIASWATDLKARDQACGEFAERVLTAALDLDVASLIKLAGTQGANFENEM